MPSENPGIPEKGIRIYYCAKCNYQTEWRYLGLSDDEEFHLKSCIDCNTQELKPAWWRIKGAGVELRD
jgi:hypothetical protein